MPTIVDLGVLGLCAGAAGLAAWSVSTVLRACQRASKLSG
jgi:hypothetical protein